MTYHRDHPKYREWLLVKDIPVEPTPFVRKWEREYRRTRWVERYGRFYPAPGWGPEAVALPRPARNTPTYAGKI